MRTIFVEDPLITRVVSEKDPERLVRPVVDGVVVTDRLCASEWAALQNVLRAVELVTERQGVAGLEQHVRQRRGLLGSGSYCEARARQTAGDIGVRWGSVAGDQPSTRESEKREAFHGTVSHMVGRLKVDCDDMGYRCDCGATTSSPPSAVYLCCQLGQSTCPRKRCLPQVVACGRGEVRRREVWCGSKSHGVHTMAEPPETPARTRGLELRGGRRGNVLPELRGVDTVLLHL